MCLVNEKTRPCIDLMLSVHVMAIIVLDTFHRYSV